MADYSKFVAAMRFQKYRLFTAVGMFALILTACTTPQLEKAFTPDMDSGESTEVISEYCISCHVHKDFEAAPHVKKVQASYAKPEYSATTECRACHTYTKTWLLDVRRSTHWPARE